jgi:amino acid transporter
VAGSAVWLSFALAGGIAALQGYSFAKLGARYPTAGGLLEYVNKGYGVGHVATIVAWLTYAANIIVTAMVAVSFGSYASDAIAGGDPVWVKGLAVALVIVMTGLNVAGSTLVAKVQSLIVFVVIGILAFFAIVTISAIDPALIAPSTYPSARDIVSGVALTFFAFLGFGVVTFTAKDLKDPSRQLPRAMTIAIGLAAVIYIAVSLGVLGTLGVEKVIAAGPTAIAVAAQPILGDLGYWLMLVTALFRDFRSDERRVVSGSRPDRASHVDRPMADGHGWTRRACADRALCRRCGRHRDGPLLRPVRDRVDRECRGADDLRTRQLRTSADQGRHGANLVILLAAVATTVITLVTFALTTLIKEPASIATLLGIVIASAILDIAWSRSRERGATASA